MHWSGIDATVLPTSQSARVVADRLTQDFPAVRGGSDVTVVASAPRSAQSGLEAYAARLGAISGASVAAPPRRLAAGLWEIEVADRSSPISAAGQRTLSAVRALRAPVAVLVGP